MPSSIEELNLHPDSDPADAEVSRRKSAQGPLDENRAAGILGLHARETERPAGCRSSTPVPSLLTDDGPLGAALVGSGQPGAGKPAQQQTQHAQQAT